MAQEYTVKSWKAWENEDGAIRDAHGNFKGSVTFEEYNSEPVDATFKTEPAPGDKKYGTVNDYTTKAGKVRMGFTRADRPLDEPRPYAPKPTTPIVDWGGKDRVIKAQWAIGQAVSLHKDNEVVTGAAFIAGGNKNLLAIEATAKQLFAMVDRVQQGETKTDPEVIAEALGIDTPLETADIPY